MTNQTGECIEWLQRHIFGDTQLHFETLNDDESIYIEFEKFNQLDDVIKCKNVSFATENLLLNAEEKLLFNDNPNLWPILKMINFKNSNNQMSSVLIRNILGFNQFWNHEKQVTVEIDAFDIYFNYVNFEFYLNETRIGKEICKPENFYGCCIVS